MNKQECIIQTKHNAKYVLDGTRLYVQEGKTRIHVANIGTDGIIRKESKEYPYPLAFIDKETGRVYRDDSKFGYLGMLSKYGFAYDKDGENIGVIYNANLLFDIFTQSAPGNRVELEHKELEEKKQKSIKQNN